MNQYEQSESIAALAPALSVAQQAAEGAIKNSNNPHFKSNFADLGAVRDAALPALKGAGLSLTQWPVGDGSTIGLVTQLTHNESGEWMRSAIFIAPDKKGPQPAGSVLTYLRRYSMAAVLGIPQVDDDGNAGQRTPEEIRDEKSHELKLEITKALNGTTDPKRLETFRQRIDQRRRDLISEDYKQLVSLADDLIKTAQEADAESFAVGGSPTY